MTEVQDDLDSDMKENRNVNDYVTSQNATKNGHVCLNNPMLEVGQKMLLGSCQR